MITKKNLTVLLLTFCLSAILFIVLPTRSQTSSYDPWADVSGPIVGEPDGTINMRDIQYEIMLFNTNGTPINKTELLVDLLNKIDSMNATINDLQSRIDELEAMSEYLPEPAYDSGWIDLSIGWNWLTHNLNTTEVFVYLIGNGTGSSPHPANTAIHQAGIGLENNWGAYWTGLNETNICIYRGPQDTEWPRARLMIWKKQGLPPPPEPIDWFNGLVGYWRIDEGTGNMTIDSSGNENNGTLINDPIWVDGKYGKAVSFDGVDDYVMIPDSQNLRVQTFTLEAWIYMTQRPWEKGMHSAIINKLNHLAGSSKGYKLQFEYPTSDNDHLVLTLGDSTAQRFLIDYNSINDLSLNQWHNVIGTYDGYTAKLYIDGQLKASTTPGAFTIVHDDTPLMFCDEYNLLGYCNYNGTIDNIMIYNRSLSAEEIMAHYLLPPP